MFFLVLLSKSVATPPYHVCRYFGEGHVDSIVAMGMQVRHLLVSFDLSSAWPVCDESHASPLRRLVRQILIDACEMQTRVSCNEDAFWQLFKPPKTSVYVIDPSDASDAVPYCVRSLCCMQLLLNMATLLI
jgi:hypothetical protein